MYVVYVLCDSMTYVCVMLTVLCVTPVANVDWYVVICAVMKVDSMYPDVSVGHMWLLSLLVFIANAEI